MRHEGRLYLIYTGATNVGKRMEQTQCIAYSEDGVHFEKYDGNPVIEAPEGVPACFSGIKGVEARRFILYGMRSQPGKEDRLCCTDQKTCFIGNM